MDFSDKETERYRLKGSFLEFLRTFYYIRNNRTFDLSEPISRECHYITIAKEFTKVFSLETLRLVLNIFPGSGKSTMACYFVAWTFTHYPDCKYLYLAHSQSLAERNTGEIKGIMSLPTYRKLFDVHIDPSSKSKSNFATTAGGRVMAFGSSGSIVGQDAGLPNLNRYSGGIIYDDAHKPDEVHSDVMRKKVIDNYNQTVKTRPRGENVPIIFIGQRLHEDDLPAYLINGEDGQDWKKVILPSIDGAGNALAPNIWSKERLLNEQKYNEYVFASQHQQNPAPAGGGIFKIDDFQIVDNRPEIESTFITIDTAETDKNYNDASVFSFWGVHKIMYNGTHLEGLYGLYWLDCHELRVEPKDLESEFMEFYSGCLNFPVQPKCVAIEKKSTGVTLSSVLKTIPGIRIIDVERTRASGSKTTRYLEAQPFVAKRLISLPYGAKHTKMCIDHMGKITHNNTHRNDDVCYVAGTKIATIRGNINIEDIKIGDKVITPFGIGNVSYCSSTGFHKVIKKHGLEATPNHPLLYGDKFLPLIKVPDTMMLSKLTFKELFRWKQRQLLYLMEKNFDCQSRQDILKLQKENIKTNFFTVLFGSFIAKRKYQKAILFTIKTTINLITVSKTLSVFHMRNIWRFIVKENPLMKNAKRLWKKCEKIHLNGIEVKKEEKNKPSWRKRISLQTIKLSVQFAINSLLRLGTECICAPMNVNEVGLMSGQETETQTNLYSNLAVYGAAKNLKQSTVSQKRTVERHAPENAQDCTDIKEVFNLTVEGYGVYYANGVLTSNCDTLYDAIKLALIDKVIINATISKTDYNMIGKSISSASNRLNTLKTRAYR